MFLFAFLHEDSWYSTPASFRKSQIFCICLCRNCIFFIFCPVRYRTAEPTPRFDGFDELDYAPPYQILSFYGSNGVRLPWKARQSICDQARRNRRTRVSVRRFGIESDKKCKKYIFCISYAKKSEIPATGWVE